MTAALRLVRGDDGGEDVDPIESWEVFMRGAGRSDRTVDDGIRTMRRLERHAGHPCDCLRPIDVSRFLANTNLKPRSRAAYFGSIAAFYKWFAKNGGTDITADLPYPRSPKGTPRPVSGAGLQTLLDSRINHRTLVMILLAAFAGLRVHEIAKMRGEDIDRDNWTLRVTGKGGRTDEVPMHRHLIAAAATMPTRGWWFPGNARRPGDHMLPKSVSDIIGQAMQRAGVPGAAHSLRHFFATQLVASGADLRTAQTLLRHSNLQTTAIYVAVHDQKRVEAIQRLDIAPGT